MCVIIDDGHAADLSFFLKTAVCTGKISQAFFHGFDVDPQKIAECQGCGGIPYVVDAGNVKRNPGDRLSFFQEGKRGMRLLIIGNVGGTVITFCIASVSDDPAGESLCDLFIIRNITVDDEDAVLRELFSEKTEGMTDVINILEEIQMIRIDVQDDAAWWGKSLKSCWYTHRLL